MAVGAVLVPQQFKAPELHGSRWFNTHRPLRLSALRGQVVLIDFWTYCCINCLHVLPTLRRIEDRFCDEPVVVLGVHAGKFDNEKHHADQDRDRSLRHHPSRPRRQQLRRLEPLRGVVLAHRGHGRRTGVPARGPGR